MRTFSKLILILTTFIVVAVMGAVVPAQASSQPPQPSFVDRSITLYSGYENYDSALTDISEEAEVTYKSSSKKVARVDEDGIITPVAAGKTTITATVKQDGATYKCTMKVTVKDPYYKLDNYSEGMFPGQSVVFSVKRYGYDESLDTVKWTLTGSQYASLESISATECILRAKEVGNVTVSVESLGVTRQVDVRIYDGTGDIFVIHPDSTPYGKKYVNRGDYNSFTSCYFLIRSYLERLDTLGGGTLVFKAGTYPVIATLCVPSNTTILLEDGVVIRKIDNTSTKAVNSTTSLFQCVASSHTTTKFTGYGGEHDIRFLGEGDATIDLASIRCTAIMMCHNKNVRISGITFKNLNGLHFIELDASKDVDISYNCFTGYVPTSTGHKEAINIDTPDKNTGGFVQGWTSYDKTPDKNVYITDNVFYNLEVGVGTHRYSQAEGCDETEGELMYHTNIEILRNSFINIATYAVRYMNWKNCVMKDNSFEQTPAFLGAISVPAEDGTLVPPVVTGVFVNGAVSPVITGNYFSDFDTVISCYPWKNSNIKSNENIDGGSSYAVTYNIFDDDTFALMSRNNAQNYTNPILWYINYNKISSRVPEVYEFESCE